MMRAVLRIIGGAFQDLWADLWTVLACNLFWLLANLLILPGPPATMAVVYYSNLLARGEQADLTDVWKAFRGYWGPAWRWGAVNLAVIAFLAADIALTGQFQEGAWKPYLQGLYVALLASWLAVQFFALPFLFEQERMSVRLAMRNAAALIGKNLGFVLALLILVLAILVAGTVAFLLSAMFGAVFLACTGSRAVLNRLEAAGLSGERE